MTNSSIKVPVSIKAIAPELNKLVVRSFPNIMSIDDVPRQISNLWLQACSGHERFHIDADRYIGDICTQIAYGG